MKPMPNISWHSRSCQLAPAKTVVQESTRERLVGDVGLDGDADVAVEVDETGEHLEAGVATGDALADLGVGFLRLGGRVLFALAVRRRQPVEAGDETEEREPGRLERLGGLAPRVGPDADPQVVVRA